MGGESRESEKERVDRELIELLNELRVVLPGVQVLFAFLLILPFEAGFEKLTSLQRGIYYGSLITTAAAVALLVAPTAWHRLRFRAGDKRRMLFTSNRFAIAGTVLLSLSMTAVVFLVTDVLFRVVWASIAAGGMALWFAVFWYVIPLARPERRWEPDT